VHERCTGGPARAKVHQEDHVSTERPRMEGRPDSNITCIFFRQDQTCTYFEKKKNHYKLHCNDLHEFLTNMTGRSKLYKS
jgi:hypothetical protein